MAGKLPPLVSDPNRPSFQDIISRFLLELRTRAHTQMMAVSGPDTPAPTRVVIGRPVHFVDDDLERDQLAEATLLQTALAAGFEQVSFQLEPVDPEIFWMFQQELSHDGERKGMLYNFEASGRMALGALSYINVESRNRSLRVQAFHTFPDDYAIVKSQSLFELP